MARAGAPSKRRPTSMDHLHRFDGAELTDGTSLTDSVFWDRRLQGVLMLDGSGRFYPASQVRFCWWESRKEPDANVIAVREMDGD